MMSLPEVPFPAKRPDLKWRNSLETRDSSFCRQDDFQDFASFCSGSEEIEKCGPRGSAKEKNAVSTSPDKFEGDIA